jgi:GNAT superfamily N-acetyltransferase
MSVSEPALIEAIESSLTVYPPVPGLAEDLGVPGLRGRVTDLSHPLANLVGMADLRDRDVDATIRLVKNRYSYGRKAFGWVTGPLTRPADLGARLVAAGLTKIDEMAGMALTDLAVPIATDPSLRVEEATLTEALDASQMMATAYDMPVEVARFFNVMLALTDRQVRNRGYFAYVEDKPVAWSFLIYLPDSPVVLLGGAATLPEHRGRGIYRALVARRLADARADGRTAAVIQAVRSTSAPIAAKLGFRELCGLEFYAWAGAAHQDVPMLKIEAPPSPR